MHLHAYPQCISPGTTEAARDTLIRRLVRIPGRTWDVPYARRAPTAPSEAVGGVPSACVLRTSATTRAPSLWPAPLAFRLIAAENDVVPCVSHNAIPIAGLLTSVGFDSCRHSSGIHDTPSPSHPLPPLLSLEFCLLPVSFSALAHTPTTWAHNSTPRCTR